MRRLFLLVLLAASHTGCPDSHSVPDDAPAVDATGDLDAPELDAPGLDAPVDPPVDAPTGGDDVPAIIPDAPLLPDAPAEPCPTPGTFEDVGCGMCGTTTRFCTSGRIWEYGDCTEPVDAVCIPGDSGTIACGTLCGTQPARCDVACHWVGMGTCSPGGACAPGTSERTGMGCAAGETRARTCDATCGWGPYGACMPAPDDFDGDGAVYDLDCDDTNPAIYPTTTRPCGSFYCAGSAMTVPGTQTCDGPGWSVCARPCPETTPCVSGRVESRRCPTAGCDAMVAETRSCVGGVWGPYDGCSAPTPRPASCDPVLAGSCGACGEGATYTICDGVCSTTTSPCVGAGCIPGTRSRDLASCGPAQYRELVCDATCATSPTACMSFPPLVDILLLVDVTGSHTAVVAENAARLATELAGGVLSDADVRVGVAHFADFPHGGYGSAPDEPFAGDLAPTADAMMVTAALSGLPSRGGGDGPESGLEALWVLAGGTPHPDSRPFTCGAGLAAGGCWRAGAQRAVVIITDIAQHDAPHPALPAGELLDPYIGFSPLPTSWAGVRDRLIAERVALFAIIPSETGWFTPSYEVVPQMELLVSELGEDPADAIAVYPMGERNWTAVSRQMAMLLARYLGLT